MKNLDSPTRTMIIRLPTMKMNLGLRKTEPGFGGETKRKSFMDSKREGNQKGLEQKRVQVKTVKEYRKKLSRSRCFLDLFIA